VKPEENGGAVVSSRKCAALFGETRMIDVLSAMVVLLCFFDIAAAYEPPVREFMDHEKTVRVSVGERFSLVLESNRTTGYGWELSPYPDSAVVKLIGTEYKEEQTGLVGVGGSEVWTFEAVGKGVIGISFWYRKPWEKEELPAKSTTFRVSVE